MSGLQSLWFSYGFRIQQDVAGRLERVLTGFRVDGLGNRSPEHQALARKSDKPYDTKPETLT